LNLNMPPRLPVREDIIDHTLDSPLTQVGLFVADTCGRAFAEAGVRFSVCYVSPALRCVQTACQLLRGAGQVGTFSCPHQWSQFTPPRRLSNGQLRGISHSRIGFAEL
uniref:ANF_receptor domain-containing protein n=1 Tax=Taenia asiatica TaxID=60517 RepID=A0A0R3VZL4_TAEAS